MPVARSIIGRNLGRGPINFLWDANDSGDNVTHYTLYYGPSTGSYSASVNVGNVTSYTLRHPGPVRYYALTASNAIGESTFSSELVR